MSAHNNGSGPRSNSYSENRFTNWSEYKPWFLEVQTIFKRFDGRIAKWPTFPKVIDLPPAADFIQPCSAKDVEAQLLAVPSGFLNDLRAVFILSGTIKQLKSWGCFDTFCGHYWNRCVFLHAYPFYRVKNLDKLRRFYLRDVLIHEIGHHVDTCNVEPKDRERFADEFAQKYG